MLDLGLINVPIVGETDLSQQEMLKCHPVTLQHGEFSETKSLKYCMVCLFEGRGGKRKTQFCKRHMMFLCTQKYDHPKNLETFTLNHKKVRCSEIDDWSFLCSDSETSCWEKAHKFYIPNKLFSLKKEVRITESIEKTDISKFDRNSLLFLQRKNAILGIENGYNCLSGKKKKIIETERNNDSK